ncbi:MAG: NTP transferase domain-containing protein [Steroidobacteraceae bacterium]
MTIGSGAAPLYGLVLAGGRSRRMQRDKAALDYHGMNQIERTLALLEGRVERAFVSVRAEQRADPLRARHALIVDAQEDLGPAGGILAAQSSHPHAAWLVLACDLPFLDGRTLDQLIASRAPQRAATAYRSSRDGLPEPLCAIYEPASHAPLASAAAVGRLCPRKFLIGADTQLLDQSEPGALENVNTPEEFQQAAAALHTPHRAAVKQVSVQYYALLREQAGRSSESLQTTAATARELYQELNQRHPFSLPPEMLRVAVNAEFAEWSAPLADGDTVVFIPPVAGG